MVLLGLKWVEKTDIQYESQFFDCLLNPVLFLSWVDLKATIL